MLLNIILKRVSKINLGTRFLKTKKMQRIFGLLAKPCVGFCKKFCQKLFMLNKIEC